MVERHIFLRSETFSHTMNGARWINFEWLSQILLYLVVKMGGLKTVLYGKVVLSLGVMALLVVLLRRTGARGIALPLLTTLGFLILRPRLYERVELATLIFMPLLVLLLRTADKKTPWILGGLMALWCNLHGGFIYGIGTVVLMNIGARWAGEDRDRIRALDKSVVFMAIASLLNPFGFGIITVFIEHLMQLFHAPIVIEEWLPPSVSEIPFFWAVFVLVGFTAATGSVGSIRRARAWIPVVVVFALWGARSTRNAAYFGFFALPFLVEFIKERTVLYAWVVQPTVRVAAFLIAFAGLAFAAPQLLKPPRSSLFVENRFPIGACRFLDDHNIQGTLYNSYQYGGYIEWASRTPRAVFMDGRYLFHPLLIDHARLDAMLYADPASTEWDAFLNRFGVDCAVVDPTMALFPSRGRAPFSFAWANLVFPREKWALIYWDDAAFVFVKRASRFDALIPAFEYKSLWPYNLDQMRAMLGAKLIVREQVETELERHRRDVPFSVTRLEIEKCLPK